MDNMKPVYQYNHSRIFNKDCCSMDELPDESVDLLATDPQYGISFMGMDWDKALPDIKIWQECLRVLKPGAFAFVMSIPRADCLSRMIISLEDAGFRVDFSPIYWAYASGFPKAQNIGKAVDKRLGVEREVTGHKGGRYNSPGTDIRGGRLVGGQPATMTELGNITAPVTPQAKVLDGSYGGFQPKPAVEVIIVAMKPLSEKTFVDQALKNGKGITWLDDCRVPYESEKAASATLRANTPNAGSAFGGGLYAPEGKVADYDPTRGRFPANLLVSDDVLNDGRVTKSGVTIQPEFVSRNVQGFQPNTKSIPRVNQHPDSGSFSRYFDLDAWWAKTFPFLIVPKASKREKNEGCEDLEERRADAYAEHRGRRMERKERFDGKPTSRGRNHHPTVKPLKLMSYLITLGSREGDMVVDPFIGSGSTAIACQILGRRCTGYEINPDYCEIAKSRLSWCRQQVLL